MLLIVMLLNVMSLIVILNVDLFPLTAFCTYNTFIQAKKTHVIVSKQSSHAPCIFHYNSNCDNFGQET